MGSSRWDPSDWKSYTRTTRSKTIDEVFVRNDLDEELDPKKAKLRESRDSVLNPNSSAIIVDLDVTASMGYLADNLAKKGLGVLFEEILSRKPVPDPHIMVMGNGDSYYDIVPLQVSQFEADITITKWLEKLYLEKGGGGNNFESYNLPWYFAATRTAIDCFEKRGKKGYCNVPESPVWMKNNTFKRIGDIQSGDEVVGWQRINGKRRVVPSRVLAIDSRRADDVVRSTMRSGRTVTCTADHRWLSGHHKMGAPDVWTNVSWDHNRGRRADGRQMGVLSKVLEPYEPIPPDLAIDAAWLAGIYDGEGNENSICQYRDHNPEVCDRIERTLDLLGFDWICRDNTYFLLGGLSTYVKILSLPITRRHQLERLILESKSARYVYRDVRAPMFRRTGDPVMEVEIIPNQEVVSMRTSTGNYVISGYASSNCFTVGDEMPPPVLLAAHINEVIGDTPQYDLQTPDLLAMVGRMYHVFHVIVEEGDYARGHLDKVVSAWTSLLGQRALRLSDHSKLAEVIVSAIEVSEGKDRDAVVKSWDKSTAMVVGHAIATPATVASRKGVVRV